MTCCPHCEKELPDDMEYCGYCGRRIKPRILSAEEKRTNDFLLIAFLASLVFCYIAYAVSRWPLIWK
jgi:predicted nucleic acid-binding Zn ribbon protein